MHAFDTIIVAFMLNRSKMHSVFCLHNFNFSPLLTSYRKTLGDFFINRTTPDGAQKTHQIIFRIQINTRSQVQHNSVKCLCSTHFDDVIANATPWSLKAFACSKHLATSSSTNASHSHNSFTKCAKLSVLKQNGSG